MILNEYKKHILYSGSSLKKAIKLISKLPEEGVLFIIDSKHRLLGSLTDGDIRRSLLNKTINIDSSIDQLMNPSPKFISINNIDLNEIEKLKEDSYKIIPIIDDK